METYGSIKTRVLRTLNDPSSRTHGDSIVYDAVAAAHMALMPWVPKPATATLSSGSDGILLSLPADLYAIQALQLVSSGEFLPRSTLTPRSIRHSEGTVIDWIDYPYGYVSLSKSYDEGTEFKLYYLAYWNQPASENDTTFVLEVPRMAHQGLVYYACAHCLCPQSVNSANIRQFNLRIDSGTPEDNPLKVEAQRFLDLFHHEMKLMPPYQKVTQ